MLVDRREIEFNADTLLAALAASQKAAESFGLPGTAPHAVRFYPKEGEVGFLYGTPQTPRAVQLKAATVGALLISYCIRSKIPLPKRANKGVRIEANSIILAFRVVYHDVLKPGAESRSIVSSADVTSWVWVEPDHVVR